MRQSSAVLARDISKSYGGRPIFRDLNLSILRGQFTVLLGKNGTGKSTLLRLIAGLEPANVGVIEALGSNVENESVERRQKIAFISEQITLDPTKKLCAIKELTRPLYPKWDDTVFDKFLYTFNLPSESRFGALSRGQRVQFFFAIAAASKPELFLLDEVTSVLDASARFEVMNHLRSEVSKGASVILATNIAAETQNFADQIVFLLNGALGLSCSVDELQTRFAKFRISLKGGHQILPREARPVQLNGDGSISYLIPATSLQQKVAGASSDLRGVTIEDLFIYFTGPESKNAKPL